VVKVAAWVALPDRRDRLTFEALDAPAQVLVSEHALPELDGTLDADGAHALGRAVYDAMRTAAAGAGLVDVGVPTLPDVPGSRRQRRRQPPVFLWGPEVEVMIEDNKAHPPACTCGGFPIGRVIWSDPARTTFMMVVSDHDHEMAEDFYAWGPDAARCLEAVDAALDADEFWR
jgi:hypothetical protein